MFGYVVVDKPELKLKEFDVYRSYYCGLCRCLKKRHGLAGQLTLSYDMTFLVMLLTSLYEPDMSHGTCKCVAHPFKEQHTSVSVYSAYAADMNVILSYYKCIDDWQDEKKFSRLAFSKFLKKGALHLSSNYAYSNNVTNDHTKFSKNFISYDEKSKKIKNLLEILKKNETSNVTDIDTMAGTFGNIMSVLFTPHHDEWELPLSKLGFFLGKFIYILDAYDDIEKDITNNSYNPFQNIYMNANFSDTVISMLKMMMSECARVFEMLPVIDNIEILRNILYAGVWQSKALHKYAN